MSIGFKSTFLIDILNNISAQEILFELADPSRAGVIVPVEPVSYTHLSLGVTFVFFAGILAGHLGFSIDPHMLNYAESFGLVLFVYELGLQVGPGFFSSFRKGGVQLNMLGIGAVSYTHLIIDLYSFDKQLRALLFTAIQTIEVAVRTKIIKHFALCLLYTSRCV